MFANEESLTGVHIAISTPNIGENTELLCRYTGLADAWWRWQRDGFLHLPGFFSYMEELGVFKRIRKYLSKWDMGGNGNSLMDPNCGMIQRCYSMLSEMVQRDPAYYAILVACRPDQNWRLIHCLEKRGKRALFDSDDLAFGVTMDRIKLLVKGEGTSDIQSTAVFPTLEESQKIRLVPGFHRELHSWLRSSFEMKHGHGYEKFGQAQEIAVQPGDLVICLPQILRWPKSFSSSNLFNLSQTGMEQNLPTTPERCIERTKTVTPGNSWEQLEPQYENSDGEVQQYDWEESDWTEHGWHSGSAIAEALAGRLDWNSSKAIEEATCILGTNGVPAVKLVQKSRALLADRFHQILNSTEEGLTLDAGIRNSFHFYQNDADLN